MEQLKVIYKTGDMTREEWLEKRQKGIGGSDAGAILGVNSYKNPVALWLEKTGQIKPEPAGEAAEMGIVLEPVIADLFQARTGIQIKKCDALLQHPEHDFMLANVDRLISGQRLGLECKNVSLRKADEWKDDEIPDSYYAQCQHYIAVTGYDGWHIAALINGNHFISKFIPRNDSFINAMIEAERVFWNCVQNKIMPDAQLNTDVLKMLYPESNGKIVTLPEAAQKLVATYEHNKMMAEEYKKRKEKAQVELCGMIGTNRSGITPDGSNEVVWSQVNPQPKFNVEKFAAENPDLFKKYAEPAKPYRRFSIKNLK